DEAGEKELKPIQKRGAGEIPYLALLGRDAEALPIVRIIVGPCRDQKTAFKKAKDLTKGKVEVIVSDTPFLG
ncbi:MAG TPA: hypothetical protein VFN88_02825, partial [Caulobacteraceae bacterium]|nr:hypothetical protein [Caulobacteraceae bacterium]